MDLIAQSQPQNGFFTGQFNTAIGKQALQWAGYSGSGNAVLWRENDVATKWHPLLHVTHPVQVGQPQFELPHAVVPYVCLLLAVCVLLLELAFGRRARRSGQQLLPAVAVTLMVMLCNTPTVYAKPPSSVPSSAPMVSSGPSRVPILQVPQLQKIPVGSITFNDIGVLNIKPDITAEESAWLTQMLVVAVLRSGDQRHISDFQAFIFLHKLQRFFDPIPSPVSSAPGAK